MKVVALVGGVGGARFLLGLKAALGIPGSDAHQITALVNVGDDIWLHGLRICPDLDTCMYTLGGGIDTERGWGRAKESWTIGEELAAYGADPSWFGLGDRDVATHLIRSRMLRAGYPLSAVTEALCARWQPGVRLLPASDDRVETHVVVDDDTPDGPAQRAIHFQEWWVRHRGKLKAHRFASVGAEEATAAPGVLEAIAEADVVLLAPSNPVVSVGTILAVPGIKAALRAGPAPVIGLSPIVGGRPLRGMADACLDAIGVETSAEGVGRHYGARSSADGLLDGWLVHETDQAVVEGVAVRAVPLLMTDTETTARMARQALELAGVAGAFSDD
ncbi:2-phospho-L-lactate transferase [Pseudonocardia spinosispora]|uniref:2-phospho-L-lactate transferase n=1 Tax=Pseudonocardia spinosispora TaxID=103441 RepID=UPI00049117D9|nr:2-phospho-L-lactate transferase [Pseudonocardia spinosispora]